MALSRVLGDDELYIGGIFTLRRKSALSSTGITHIVSVLHYDFKDFEDWEKYEHLSIEVDDTEDENLLGEFERSGSFIEEALKSGKVEGQERGSSEGEDGMKKPGKVLVHCAMGKSRSVTIAMAFLLRKYPHYTVASTLSLIRKSRPIAEPNDGFMAQLKLYREMGCPRDIDAHPKYQRWLYQREVDSALAAGMAPEKVRFEDEVEGEKNRGQKEGGSGREVELRCRKCRRTLATTPYLVTHTPPKDPTSQTTPISSLIQPPTSTACTHHFLQPLSWMRPALEQGLLQGRFECPNAKCQAQLGRYAWQGMRCSCGIWVCPAFSLQKGRVDEVVKKGVAAQSQGQRQGQGKTNDFRVASAGGDVQAKDEAVGGEGPTGIRLPPGIRGKENL